VARVTLIEASPADPTSGAAVAVRLAAGGTRGYGHKGFTDWLAGVASEPRFASSIGFDQGGWTGASSPTSAQLVFTARRADRLSSVAGYYWIGAPIIVSTGDDALAPDWKVRATGTVTAITVDGAAVTLTIADRSGELYMPALPDTFLGTGDVEGGPDAAGRLKRRSFGTVFNIEGRLLDAAYNVYEFGDPFRAIGGFDAVRDRGVTGDSSSVVAWQGSAVATLAALRQAAPPPGGCTVAPSIGCVRCATQPSGPLTADLRGEAAGSAAGDLAAAIAASFASDVTVAAADVQALNAATPGTLGIHCDDGGETVAALLDRLLLPLSIQWLFDPDGTMRLRSLGFGGATETVRILVPPRRDALYPPTLKRLLGYKRNHRRQTDSEIATVTGGDGADVDGAAALTELAVIESDAWLSRDEKPTVITTVANIKSEYPQVVARAQALGLATDGYAAAYNALLAFLAALSPAWNDTSKNTPLPDSNTLQAKFAGYFGARDALQQAIGTTISTSIANISSDNLISAGSEKGDLVRDQQAAQAQYKATVAVSNQIGDAFASDPTKSQRTDLGNAWFYLMTYLNGLSPAWSDITKSTPVDGSALRTLFANFETAVTALDQANQVYSAGRIASTLATLAAIASDGVLTPAEKRVVISDWNAIFGECGTLQALAAAVGVDHRAYDLVFLDLQSYLSGLNPAWNDLTQNTNINSANFNAKFVAYYNAKAALLQTMQQAAAQSIPVVNRIKFSAFENGTKGWRFYDPNSLRTQDMFTSSYQGLPYLGLRWNPTASGQYASLYTDTGYKFAVTPGERLCVAIGAQTYGPVQTQLIGLGTFDASGVATYQYAYRSGSHGFNDRFFAFFTVPAGAVTGQVEFGASANGAGSTSNLMDMALTQPMVCAVSAATTVPPNYVPGPNSDDGADVTGQNTAADTTAVAGVPAAELTQTASDAHGLATTANQFAADAADNDHMSGDEKKRWRGTIQAWAGTGDGSVSAIVNKLNAYGQTLNALQVAQAWSNGSTAFYDLLQKMNYAGSGSTKFSDVGSSRDGFKAAEKAFADALENASKALTAYASTVSVQTSANIFTDPRFSRLGSTADWSQVTLGNGANAEDSSDGRRLRCPGGSQQTLVKTPAFPVSAGDRIDIKADVYDQGASGGSVQAWLQLLDNNKNPTGQYPNIFSFANGALADNIWLTGLDGSTTITTDAAYACCYLQLTHTSGTVFVRNPMGTKVHNYAKNLLSNGRQGTALMTTAYAVNGSVQVTDPGASSDSSSITLNNFSVDFGDGFQSITGTTFTGLAAATRYYIWLLAPAMSNAFRSFSISTSFTGNADKQRVFLGAVYTKTSTGADPTPGSSVGRNTACVAIESFLVDCQASEARGGTAIELLKPDWSGAELTTIAELPEWALAECVRLTTPRGAELVCSVSTPIELRDGRTVMASDAGGCEVATIVDDVFAIDRIAGVVAVGLRWVARIHVGGRIYAAGAERRARIFTHNPVKP
jgi:hypothetical protein